MPLLLFSIFINSLRCILHYWHFLCFADDIKLFMEIQCDINRFVDLFGKLGLSLNISKCKVIIFTRSLNSTMFSYLLRDSVIVYCDEFFMDLGFKLTILDLSPNIEKNYLSICYKTFKILGFIS